MQNVITKQSISLSLAENTLKAAQQKALEISVPMSISIVDESGIDKSSVRMDGAALLSVEIARNKAYTAVSFGMPTDGWFDFIKNDPPLLHGIVHTPRLVVFGGGYPIEIDGAIVGGIGVSGGHYSQDMDVAQFALASIQK